MSEVGRVIDRFGGNVILAVEVLVLVLVALLIIMASYVSVRDLRSVLTPYVTYSEIIELIINDVFTLVVLAEIMRFIIALRASPGTRIIGLAEVGLIVSIREVILASVMKEYLGLLLSSVASIILALIIWLVKTKIVR
ncbi:MAG: hypothetical protein LM560_06735 [Desulfurococcaceae archaeon]|nr:hypothetical protein [Desulfurococcaceae archaeon]